MPACSSFFSRLFLLFSLFICSPDAKEGYIIDLRSSSDAQSAKGKGGGPELIDNYFSWKLVLLARA